MSAEIRSLPGVFRRELEQATPVEAVLRAAMEAGLRDVVLVGRTIAGDIAVFGSLIDADATIGLLTRGIADLVDAEQVNVPTDDTA